MGWQTPKTNWTSADGVTSADFNRMEGNDMCLRTCLDVNGGMYAQAIINSDFDIWQRGTSLTTMNTYLPDRWATLVDGSVVSNWGRQAFVPGQVAVPNNPTYFLRMQVTSASGQSFYYLGQSIEDVSSFAGMNATISFWAKADAARTISCGFKQVFGVGGSGSVYTTTQNANLTTAWQKFTLTFAIPSISGKTIGTDFSHYLSLLFNFPLNTAQTIDIAQVQMNAGTEALAYKPKSFAEELRDCQRYYEKSYDVETPPGSLTSVGCAIGISMNSVHISCGTLPYKVPKRVIPNVTPFSWKTGATGKFYNSSGAADVLAAISSASSKYGVFIYGGAVMTVGSEVNLHWVANAEF
jgi:hypothetical protein